MNNFLFICGAPRSGTTLLTNLLDGHPELAVYPRGETHILQYWNYHRANNSLNRFFTRDFLNTEDILFLTEENAIAQHNDYIRNRYGVDKVYAQHIIDRNQFIKNYLDSIKANGISIKSIYNAVLTASYEENLSPGSNSYFVEKRPLDNELSAIRLSEEFPDAKFIHILRDPRTRYLSAKMRRVDKCWGYPLVAPNLNGKDFATGHSEITMTSMILAKLNSIILKDRYLLIKYEDLISNPQNELHKITNFLRIDYQDKLLKQTFLNQDVSPASSITNSPQEGIKNTNEQRLNSYYKHTSRLEQKILNLFTWEIANYFGYDIKKVSTVNKRDLFSPLKYEDPRNYIANRIRMLKGLKGYSWFITNKHYHKLADNFDKGIPTTD